MDKLEDWISNSVFMKEIHFNLLGFMYSLTPEGDSKFIPLAILPTPVTPTCLEASQVIFLNSFMPFENKSEWRFLFSYITHGESFSKFAGSITNQGPLLIVLESDNEYKFGGFISESISPSPLWLGECFVTHKNIQYVQFNCTNATYSIAIALL